MSSMFGIELPFYTYGILMGVAFLFGVWFCKYNSKVSELPTPPFIDLILVLSICGVVGARINYILLFPQYYHSLRDCLALHEGGLVFYGGMVLAILGLFIYCKIKKYSFGVVADYMVPSLAIGHAMGRVGCLINDCCYGAVTNSIRIYHLKNEPMDCFRHPTQLYEIVYLITLAMIFTWLLKKDSKRPRKNGSLTAWYCVSYATLRFLNEYLRADDRGGFFTSLRLSPAQITSIIMAFCGILWLYVNRNKSNQPADCGDKTK